MKLKRAKDQVLNQHLSGFDAAVAGIMLPEEVPNDLVCWEGAKSTICVNRYERDPKARSQCVKIHGLDCKVCGVNFEEIYGWIGKHYIHVHQLIPIASISESYQIDPLKDLVPVCPNCHAMLHERNPPFTVDELKALMP